MRKLIILICLFITGVASAYAKSTGLQGYEEQLESIGFERIGAECFFLQYAKFLDKNYSVSYKSRRIIIREGRIRNKNIENYFYGENKYTVERDGEWGGQFKVFNQKFGERILINDVVRSVHKWYGKLIVFSGLAHLNPYGKIFTISDFDKSNPIVERLSLLSDSPELVIHLNSEQRREVQYFLIVGTESILKVNPHFESFDILYLDKRINIMPNSWVLLDNNNLLLGIQGAVALVRFGGGDAELSFFVKHVGVTSSG